MPDRRRHHRAPRATGYRDRDHRRDSGLRYQAGWVMPCTAAAPPSTPGSLADPDLGFLHYLAIVTTYSFVAIYKIAPVYGKKNPLIFLSICSLVGSVSVMSVKAFGIALKLTINGNNQFSHPSTYVFMIITTVCILTQMNYFNKALSHFPTNM